MFVRERESARMCVKAKKTFFSTVYYGEDVYREIAVWCREGKKSIIQARKNLRKLLSVHLHTE